MCLCVIIGGFSAVCKHPDYCLPVADFARAVETDDFQSDRCAWPSFAVSLLPSNAFLSREFVPLSLPALPIPQASTRPGPLPSTVEFHETITAPIPAHVTLPVHNQFAVAFLNMGGSAFQTIEAFMEMTLFILHS